MSNFASGTHRYLLQALAVGLLLGFSRGADVPPRSGVSGLTALEKRPVPTLVGVMSDKTGDRFCIGFSEGTEIKDATWATIGERIRGLEIKLYDKAEQVLFVQYDNALVYKLRLSEGKVKESVLPALSRESARAYLDQQLVQLHKARDEMPVKVKVDVVSEDEMTGEEKLRYAKARAAAFRRGQAFLVVKIDGKIRTIEKEMHPTPPLPEFVMKNLTETDIREFGQANLLATAEFMEAAKLSKKSNPVAMPQKAPRKK